MKEKFMNLLWYLYNLPRIGELLDKEEQLERLEAEIKHLSDNVKPQAFATAKTIKEWKFRRYDG